MPSKRKRSPPIIEEIFNESNQVFGARKINAVLRLRGYTVADKTVAAIIHENGWFSVRGGAKRIYEMTKSLSLKSMPYDNSVMEAFFKTLKAEELYRNNYRSEREFREHVEAYIKFNNGKRPHQINHYRTPDAEVCHIN